MNRNDQRWQTASGAAKSSVKLVRDEGYVWLLAILIWMIFYQNLPLDYGSPSLPDSGGSSNGGDRLLKLGMLAISCCLIASKWGLARKLGKLLNPGFALFCAVALASTLWSIDQGATLLRYITLITIVMVCFAFGLGSWNARRFQQVVLPPILLLLVASLILGMIDPSLVLEVGESISLKDAWHGVVHTKNEFGMLSSFGVIMCAHAVIAKEGRTFLSMVGAAIAFTCLILSRSNTSLFSTLLAVLTMFLMLRVPVVRQRYTPLVVVAIAAVILLYELIIQNVVPGLGVLLSPITSLTGKDTTFSARTVIWTIVKEHIDLAPFLGSGYGAYWVGPVPTSPSYVFLSRMYGFYPTEAHNGYLEVVNDLGLLGLVCVLLFIVAYIRQSLRLIRVDRSQAALYIALLFEQMVMNLSESEWFSRSTVSSMLLLASICLSRSLLDARLRQVPPVTSLRASS